ncbi:PadR family transcriptional regulator [Halorientalis brevis]|uniref:PadR family transcriptional regulator n=1 Tax=Halorientalis brevis TaxID=1126241 RepID=A0ABD6CCJ1_9EURY
MQNVERPDSYLPSWRELSDTERDVFVAVLALHADERPPTGKAVKNKVQQRRSMTQPTVYRALRSLTEAGYVEKDRGEQDGRMTIYSVTEQSISEFVRVRSEEYDVVEQVVTQMFPTATSV